MAASMLNGTDIREVSKSPKVFILENFLTEEECAYFISLSRPHLQQSFTYVDGEHRVPIKGHKVKMTSARKSSSFTIPHSWNHIKAIRLVNQRIAATCTMPLSSGEELQIQRYVEGGMYALHEDSFTSSNRSRHAQRIVTFLIYLSDHEEGKGGETIFPFASPDIFYQNFAAWDKSRELILSKFNLMGQCSKFERLFYNDWMEKEVLHRLCSLDGVLKIRPKKGRAVLFFPGFKNGTNNEVSLHASCPLLEGEKWTLQKWFQNTPVVSET